MQGKRIDRISSLIKEELGRIITTRMKDQRLGFTTVQAVAASPDLKYCKVFVSILGDEKQIKRTMAALKHAEGFLKTEVSHALQLRLTPELHFIHDTTIESSLRLEKIFDHIHKERGANEPRES
jgi:ribosome-binding factor A